MTQQTTNNQVKTACSDMIERVNVEQDSDVCTASAMNCSETCGAWSLASRIMKWNRKPTKKHVVWFAMFCSQVSRLVQRKGWNQ